MPTFLKQLEPYASDANQFGRLSADFHDLSKACEWFLLAIKANDSKLLTTSEIEDLLVDIDVKFIQHVTFHLDTLRKDLTEILKKFPDNK